MFEYIIYLSSGLLKPRLNSAQPDGSNLEELKRRLFNQLKFHVYNNHQGIIAILQNFILLGSAENLGRTPSGERTPVQFSYEYEF